MLIIVSFKGCRLRQELLLLDLYSFYTPLSSEALKSLANYDLIQCEFNS